MALPPEAPRIVPLLHWPLPHQHLWQAGLSPDNLDEEDDPPYGCTLSPITVRNAARGWGRFLATQADNLAAAPAALVTPKAIRTFIAAMKAAGNSHTTLAARLWELRTALRILCPGADFRWITSPGGTDIRTLLKDPTPRRRAKVHHSRELYEWGLGLMEQSATIATPHRRAIRYRNGLLIAVLASRAPRLRSAATLQFGTQIIRHAGGYRLRFGQADMKMGRTLEYDLPAGLVGYVEHYLRVERAQLLRGAEHPWFWVGSAGEALREAGIEQMIRRMTEKHFGAAFGPHGFRYAMGTTAPMADPRNPGVAAVLLGNTPAVAEKHYNLGQQVQAALQFQAILEEDRQRSASLARQAFKKRGG